MTWAREFRYDAGRQRYLDRNLIPSPWSFPGVWVPYANGDTWTDYDPQSDEPYGDYEVWLNTPPTPPTTNPLRSFELGIGRVDPWAGSGTTNSAYYHTDMLGTTRMLTTSSGTFEGATYTAFGERIDSAQTGGAKRYGYVGAYVYQAHSSSEMPFLHLGARYYDPGSGRFLQRDPIGIVGGLNVFAYVRNRPASSNDPTGLVDLSGNGERPPPGYVEPSRTPRPSPRPTEQPYKEMQDRIDTERRIRAVVMGCATVVGIVAGGPVGIGLGIGVAIGAVAEVW